MVKIATLFTISAIKLDDSLNRTKKIPAFFRRSRAVENGDLYKFCYLPVMLNGQ